MSSVCLRLIYRIERNSHLSKTLFFFLLLIFYFKKQQKAKQFLIQRMVPKPQFSDDILSCATASCVLVHLSESL